MALHKVTKDLLLLPTAFTGLKVVACLHLFFRVCFFVYQSLRLAGNTEVVEGKEIEVCIAPQLSLAAFLFSSNENDSVKNCLCRGYSFNLLQIPFGVIECESTVVGVVSEFLLWPTVATPAS